jgi:hypothetical protein
MENDASEGTQMKPGEEEELSVAPLPSRLCFVIMPFSDTNHCTEAEWTAVFETLIKPAVEQAGLGYECRRSSATRGNLVAQIVESLRDAHVVVADLTDRNANVFYELGVRHTLENRTILISQNRDSIPFDLRPYANHVYVWKTEAGRGEFYATIRALLQEIDERPDRPDNPISDFLTSRAVAPVTPRPPLVSTQEASVAQTLAGPLSDGVEPASLALLIARSSDQAMIRTVVRLTRAFFQEAWPAKIQDLNNHTANKQLTNNEIYEYCLPVVDQFESDITKLEEFGLALIDTDRFDLTVELLRVLEDWISWSERIWPGRSLRPVIGTPSLLALRLLANWSAKAIDNRRLDGLGSLLLTPLQTQGHSRELLSQPLIERGELFYSEAFMGYANFTTQYLFTRSWESEGVRRLFGTREDYLGSLAVFFFIDDFIYVTRHPGQDVRIYPAFRQIENGTEAVRSFIARVAASGALLEGWAKLVNETADAFKDRWAERIAPINAAPTGDPFDRFRPEPLPDAIG